MKVQDIRIHDLRRTLASYMAIIGASLPDIGAALNHKSHDSTATYARLSQDPVRMAVDKAINLMVGKVTISNFKECKETLTSIKKTDAVLHFSELITA